MTPQSNIIIDSPGRIIGWLYVPLTQERRAGIRAFEANGKRVGDALLAALDEILETSRSGTRTSSPDRPAVAALGDRAEGSCASA